MQQAQKSRVELPDKTNKQTNKQNQNIVLNLNFRDNFFFFFSQECPRWSSCSGTGETILTRNHEVVVQSLASPTGLRIWHCRELWRRLQMWLGFGIAVAVA